MYDVECPECDRCGKKPDPGAYVKKVEVLKLLKNNLSKALIQPFSMGMDEYMLDIISPGGKIIDAINELKTHTIPEKLSGADEILEGGQE